MSREEILNALDEKESSFFDFLCRKGWEIDKNDLLSIAKELAYVLADNKKLQDVKEELEERIY